ncbi:hypothetical protein ACWDBW_14145 [Streptomyces sp. NPDC001107]
MADARLRVSSSEPSDRPRDPFPGQVTPSALRPFPPQSARSRRPWVRIAELPKLEQLCARRYVERENSITVDRQTAQWLEIGVFSPRTAQECCAAGITPDMLLRPFRMAGKPLHEGQLALKQALDCQEVSAEEIRLELMRTGVLLGQERHI